jgi:hypothetical protein
MVRWLHACSAGQAAAPMMGAVKTAEAQLGRA